MYNVAPIFCPHSSWLHGCYSSEFSHRVKVIVGPAQWGTCIRTVFNVAGTSALVCWNNNIATTSPAAHDIIVLNALTGSQTAILSGHTGQINSLTYSVDGTFLVSGSSDKTIKLWDVQTGGVIKTLRHTDWINTVSISADNTMIASAARDRMICLWTIKTGSCCIIERYRDYANTFTVTFSPTNPQLLSSSGDGIIQQWDIHGHKIGPPVPGDHIAFSPDGIQFVSLKEKVVTIRNTGSRMIAMELNLANKAYYGCFSPNGKLIAVADIHTIYLWDITGSEPYLIQTLSGHSGFVASLIFSSSYCLISASRDKSIKFWQISASSIDPALPDPGSSSLTSAPIKSVSLQARDGLAFSIDSAGVVKAWDILTGYCNRSYKTQIEWIKHADIQLISNRLIVVWREVSRWELDVWDAEKGKLQAISIPHGDTQDLRIIGDGSRVLQLYKDSIQAWNIWTGESVCKERLKKGDGSFDTFQRGTPEELVHFDTLRMGGSKVLVRLGKASVQGWDFGTPGSAPTQFPEEFPGRSQLNFIDVRKWSESSPVRIEDTVTGEEVFQLYGKYAQPSVTQWDGQYLIAGYPSGEVLILDFNGLLSK